MKLGLNRTLTRFADISSAIAKGWSIAYILFCCAELGTAFLVWPGAFFGHARRFVVV
jgi:hypothetical protein